MELCKKCHKRVITTYTQFAGPRNYVWAGDKFCQCNIHVVGDDGGPKVVVQYSKGWGAAGFKTKNDD